MLKDKELARLKQKLEPLSYPEAPLLSPKTVEDFFKVPHKNSIPISQIRAYCLLMPQDKIFITLSALFSLTHPVCHRSKQAIAVRLISSANIFAKMMVLDNYFLSRLMQACADWLKAFTDEEKIFLKAQDSPSAKTFRFLIWACLKYEMVKGGGIFYKIKDHESFHDYLGLFDFKVNETAETAYVKCRNTYQAIQKKTEGYNQVKLKRTALVQSLIDYESRWIPRHSPKTRRKLKENYTQFSNTLGQLDPENKTGMSIEVSKLSPKFALVLQKTKKATTPEDAAALLG